MTSGFPTALVVVALLAVSAALDPGAAQARELDVVPGKPLLVEEREGRLIQERWRVEDGLPQNSPTRLIQSRDGYLWLGTFDGLARFDGVRFSVYHTGNTAGLSSSRITGLVEGDDGDIWVNSEGGYLSRRHAGVFETLTALPETSIFAHDLHWVGGVPWFNTDAGPGALVDGRLLLFDGLDGRPALPRGRPVGDQEGNTWFASADGLYRLDGTEVTLYTVADGLPSNQVAALAVDGDGILWVATDRGLARRSEQGFVTLTAAHGLPAEAVVWLVVDPEGALWIGAADGSIARLHGDKLSAVVSERGPVQLSLGSTRLGKDGSLWEYSQTRIRRLKDSVLFSYDLESPIQNRILYNAVLGDAEGSLWVGTLTGGLHRFKEATVMTLPKDEGVRMEEVYSVSEAGDGGLWVGTSFLGAFHLENGRFTPLADDDGLGTSIWSLREVRDGSVWVGTSGLLYRFKDGQKTIYGDEQGLPQFKILAIYEDGSGRLWIGGNGGGVSLLEGDRFRTFTTEDGLASNYVRGMLEDHRGDLWVATDGGVSRLRDGRFTTYTTADGLAHNLIRAIYEDNDGALWFGSYGNGLTRLKDGVFTAITTQDGLFDHTVSQIFEDDRGYLWMSSNRGIFAARKKDLDDFAEGRTHSVTCNHYGRAEGMRNPECNGGCQPAGCKTKDGRLWFPTADGVATVDPGRAHSNLLPPPVAIEAMIVDRQPLDLRNIHTLPAGTREVEIHYTALSFLNPANVRFKYRLEGFDRDWIDANTRRIAYYTNISPGDHHFRVIACNNDGVWNEEGASFAFAIAPYFYQTTWFLILSAAAILGFAVMGYRLRVSQLQMRAQTLSRLVDERTQELRKNQEMLVATQKMAALGRLTAGIAHEMNTPLATVRASLAEMGTLVGEYEASIAAPEVTAEDHRAIGLDMKNSLDLARMAAERACSFVRSVKAQTREAAPKEGRWFDPVPVVEECILLLSHNLRTLNCSVTFEPTDCGELFGSPERLAQVVSNLLANAIDASADRAGAIDIVLLRHEANIRLQVHDRGCGIPADLLPQIFDSMFTTKPFGQNTGLGLTIVHNIVTGVFGGTIEVDSEVGVGTNFTVEFPKSRN